MFQRSECQEYPGVSREGPHIVSLDTATDLCGVRLSACLGASSTLRSRSPAGLQVFGFPISQTPRLLLCLPFPSTSRYSLMACMEPRNLVASSTPPYGACGRASDCLCCGSLDKGANHSQEWLIQFPAHRHFLTRNIPQPFYEHRRNLQSCWFHRSTIQGVIQRHDSPRFRCEIKPLNEMGIQSWSVGA